MGGVMLARVGVNPTAAPAATAIVDVIGVTVNNAYSLRKVRAAYAGSAIRVRRSSDNTEQDIGFDGTGYLDTAALATFVGANDGFVKIFYDQSGNSYDLSQSTTANQPQIVSSGTLITISAGRASMQFDGSNDILIPATSTTISQSFNRAWVLKFLSISSGQNICSDNVGNSIYFSASGTLSSYAGSTSNIKTGISANDKASVVERLNFPSGSAFYNGAAGYTGTPGSDPSLRRSLGGSWSGTTASAWANILCSEHIIWASQLSDPNTVTLFNNQMAYWGVP